MTHAGRDHGLQKSSCIVWERSRHSNQKIVMEDGQVMARQAGPSLPHDSLRPNTRHISRISWLVICATSCHRQVTFRCGRIPGAAADNKGVETWVLPIVLVTCHAKPSFGNKWRMRIPFSRTRLAAASREAESGREECALYPSDLDDNKTVNRKRGATWD